MSINNRHNLIRSHAIGIKAVPLQILLVEDNATDAELIREMFRKERPDSFELTHLLSITDAIRHLANGGVDIVLLDLGLPDGDGLETVRRAHAAAPDVPLIVLTGLDDEQLAAQAMKVGAQDYLIKGHIQNRALPRALRYAIERQHMQTETEGIRKQQLQFKDEFLSHVSHELRSPLTAIYQFATILADGLAGENSPEQSQYLQTIVKNTGQLKSMIDDLLEVTRAQGGKLSIELQCCVIAEAIRYAADTLQGHAAAKAISLCVIVAPGLPTACADPMRVRQILLVLIDNAIKFTPPNGTVTVTVRQAVEDPDTLVVEVADTGLGFQPELAERIFERLYQAPDPAQGGRKGLGLGLYICKDLVDRQGGKIWASSAPGRGAVFSFTLPLFSMANMITPAIQSATPGQDSIALIVTEVDSRSVGASSELRGELRRRIRELLERGLRGQYDTVLPKIGSAAAADLFFMVAVADEVGSEAIVQRIRGQLRRFRQMQGAELQFAVSHHLLKLTKIPAAESGQSLIDEVSASIQGLVNDEITKRTILNEQDHSDR
jgi:signal transduction histidine kinase